MTTKVTSPNQVSLGDTITVTFTGKIIADPKSEYIGVRVEHPAGRVNHHYLNPGEDAYTVELVEPKYVYGELYRDAVGRAYEYRPLGRGAEKSWLNVGDGCWHHFDGPRRPLVHLVPEGTSHD